MWSRRRTSPVCVSLRKLASRPSASGWPPKSCAAAFSSLSVPHTPLSRSNAAPASSDSRSTSTTGAAPFCQRAMSLTASRLVSTIRPCAARRRRREAPQQRAQALVLQLAQLRAGAVLQRLDAVEHEQHAALASSPRRSPRPWRWRSSSSAVMPSLSSAQLRNSSAEVARSFVPWL